MNRAPSLETSQFFRSYGSSQLQPSQVLTSRSRKNLSRCSFGGYMESSNGMQRYLPQFRNLEGSQNSEVMSITKRTESGNRLDGMVSSEISQLVKNGSLPR